MQPTNRLSIAILWTTLEQMRAADERLKAVRRVCLKQSQQAQMDEQHLQELVKKMAQVLPETDRNDELVTLAHREIESKRREPRAHLEAATTMHDEALRTLRIALDNYNAARADVER